MQWLKRLKIEMAEDVKNIAKYLDMSEKDLIKIIELMKDKTPECIKNALINGDGMCGTLINKIFAVFS